ncbi:HNH endonuclease [Pseudolactococcus reticulitermitis]
MKEADYIRIYIADTGRSFIVDAEDELCVKKHIWSVDRSGYVMSHDISLHRYLLQPSLNIVVDHINRNPTDCRRKNLRLATSQQNSYNAGVSKNKTTGYKGIYFEKSRNKYVAGIKPNGKHIF